jgi:hypothetical protein
MRRCPLALTLVIALAGCSTVEIDTHYRRDLDDRANRSFDWIPAQAGVEPSAGIRDPAVRQLVRDTIEQLLTARQFVKAAPGTTPDFLIAVHGSVRGRIEVQRHGYAYGRGGYGMFPAAGGPAIELRQYREGTIVVDFIDAGTRELFWRGAATNTFTPGAGRAAIREALVKLLAAYPTPRR